MIGIVGIIYILNLLDKSLTKKHYAQNKKQIFILHRVD